MALPHTSVHPVHFYLVTIQLKFLDSNKHNVTLTLYKLGETHHSSKKKKDTMSI